MTDDGHAKTQNGDNGNVGGGGDDVPFSTYKYDDMNSSHRADIELIDDEGNVVKPLPNLVPSATPVTLNPILHGIQSVKATVKDGDDTVYVNTLMSSKNKNYFNNVTLDCRRNVSFSGDEQATAG